MTRQYDSSRRKKAAKQTHKQILQAALKLHWEGITEFEALAEETGCPLATVRKHFPTKEILFRECTQTFTDTLTMPDLIALRGIDEPSKRLEESVSELCRIHEAMFGYAWFSAHQRGVSEALDAVMSTYDGLTDAIAEIIAPLVSPRASLVRGLLDFLTYRALRLSAQLSPDRIRHELIATLDLLAQSATTATVYSQLKEDEPK